MLQKQCRDCAASTNRLTLDCRSHQHRGEPRARQRQVFRAELQEAIRPNLHLPSGNRKVVSAPPFVRCEYQRPRQRLNSQPLFEHRRYCGHFRHQDLQHRVAIDMFQAKRLAIVERQVQLVHRGCVENTAIQETTVDFRFIQTPGSANCISEPPPWDSQGQQTDHRVPRLRRESTLRWRHGCSARDEGSRRTATQCETNLNRT